MKIIDFNQLSNKDKINTIPLLLNSYIKNQTHNNLLLNCFEKKELANMLHKVIRQHINQSQIILATEGESEILSYLIYSKDKKFIHFVYTKLPYRKLSIARDLINFAFDKNLDDVTYCTNTQSFPFFIKKVSDKIKFNPKEFYKSIAGVC